MCKIGFLILIMMMTSVTALADDVIHLDYDTKTQIRLPTPVQVKKAIDGQTVLSNDGKIYALTGLDMADNSDAAYKRLTELTEGKKCTLYQTRTDKTGRINRRDQILGHLTCGKDDVWVQGTLIAEGLARVRTTPENNQLADAMLKLESAARSKKSGLWADANNQILNPQNAAKHVNSFAIVEGRVYAAAQNKQSIFLNFTSDWKTDFSIGIPAKLRRDFGKKRIDPLSLKGKIVRVRGWMRDYNGPYIELDHVDQLEIIESNGAKNISSDKPDSSPAVQNDNNKQFMHSIGGGTVPEPTVQPPAAPTVEKPVVKKPSIKKD